MKEVSLRIIWIFLFLLLNICAKSQSCNECNVQGRWHEVLDDFPLMTLNELSSSLEEIQNIIDSDITVISLDDEPHYVFRDDCTVRFQNVIEFSYQLRSLEGCEEVELLVSEKGSELLNSFGTIVLHSRKLMVANIGIERRFLVNIGDSSGALNGSEMSSNENDCNELECPSIEVNFDLLETEDDKTVQFVNQSVGASIPNWDFGDGSTNSNLSPKYTYQESGNYSICLTMSNVCGDSESQCSNITLDFTSPTSEIIETNFTVYPIPTKEELIVESAAPSPLEAEIYNLQGILMMNMTLINGANLIDVYALPSGSYFIKTIEGFTKFIKE